MTMLLSINQDWKILPITFELRGIIQKPRKIKQYDQFCLKSCKMSQNQTSNNNETIFKSANRTNEGSQENQCQVVGCEQLRFIKAFFAVWIAFGLRSQSSSHCAQLG